MLNLQMERFKRLPKHPQETWQGGFVRLPTWVTEEGPKPFRPLAPVWVSLQTGMVHAGEAIAPSEKDPGKAVDALAAFAMNQTIAGYRPGKLEVNDPDLAEQLAELLAGADVTVTYREQLLTVKRFMAEAADAMSGGEVIPGALAAKGVTVDRMRAFAEAAKAFYDAAVWDQLGGGDLIAIEGPSTEPDMKYVLVLGAGGETCGLGFCRSPEHFWQLQDPEIVEDLLSGEEGAVWSVLYDDITELPLDDADLWLDHDLPVAGDLAYPAAICYVQGGRLRRPGLGALAFLEGLLRALAASSEDEMDSARWTKQVETFAGPSSYTLALPLMLDPPSRKDRSGRGLMPDRRATEQTMARIHRFIAEHPTDEIDELNEMINRKFAGKTPEQMGYEPETPIERAQDLCYQAFGSEGRRRVALARKALRICPDCADAYVILAENVGSGDKALGLYAKGVEAGRRALGEEYFELEAGQFWGDLESRPYMRARLGLATGLQALGKYEQAAEHYAELLRLNPDDNQGVRDLLLPALLALDRDEQAKKLLGKYKDDPKATWLYGRALMAFRREGDTAGARRLLRAALEANKHVPKYLLGQSEATHCPATYALGSETEAVLCADESQRAWEKTPGALSWLEATSKAGGRRAKKAPRGKKKTGSRRKTS